MDKDINKAWNNTIGRVLTYLDEADVGTAVKRAVKADMWAFYDNYITKGEDQEYGIKTINGNR